MKKKQVSNLLFFINQCENKYEWNKWKNNNSINHQTDSFPCLCLSRTAIGRPHSKPINLAIFLVLKLKKKNVILRSLCFDICVEFFPESLILGAPVTIISAWEAIISSEMRSFWGVINHVAVVARLSFAISIRCHCKNDSNHRGLQNFNL